MMSQPQLQIQHTLPGRTRLGGAALKRNALLGVLLSKRLDTLPGVHGHRLNLACGSVVLLHAETLAPQSLLAEALCCLGRLKTPLPGQPSCLSPLCGPIAKHGANPETEACAQPASGACTARACAATRSGCDPVRPALRRFAATSAVMGVVFFRSAVLGATTASGVFSPLGLAALAASLPLLRQATRQMRRRKLTLETFLGAGVVAAAAAGEALTAMEILWIQSGADLLSAWVTERSRRSIAGILRLSAHHTFILVDGVEVEAEVDSLKPGDVVVLHTGEKVCVDGVIIQGEATLDESPITGRADRVLKGEGERVLAGTFVSEGVINVRANAVGDRTYLARVLKQVEDAIENRAPIEGEADRLARRLVRIGFLATGGTLLLTGNLWRAFTVMLVMACPCATVLAASTAVSAALSAAANKGILIKGGRYLEAVGGLDTVCFDKTGTLTTMRPELCRIVPLAGDAEEELLRLAVSVEAHNHHPLAQAVKAAAQERGLSATPHHVCQYFLGMGMRAEVDDSVLLLGNRRFMDSHAVRLGQSAAKAQHLRSRGLTVLTMARNGEAVALFAFDNTIRAESAAVLRDLRAGGASRFELVTGDELGAARALAGRLGIEGVHAALLPEDKARIVRSLRAEGARVLMVGDGINDALALAEADVGVAMGVGGSEAAIEAADIALVGEDLSGLTYVRALSRQTINVARQNFLLATSTNLGGAALGALGLLSPVAAGLLHIVHTAGVLANSARLLRFEHTTAPLAIAAGADKECA
ncbi:heavy metal translocating P-type ATPase [Humidesulfovibrio sp.]